MNPEKWARIHLRLRPRRVRPGGTFSNPVGTSPCVGENLTAWLCACINGWDNATFFDDVQRILFAPCLKRCGAVLELGYSILEIKMFGLGSRIQDMVFLIHLKCTENNLNIRDVTTGATGATPVAPKFSDTLNLIPTKGSRFCPPSQRL